MKLKKITVENFKCFDHKTDIEFGKITLLTGQNSSGKSSLMYSVLGSLQSSEFPFQFSTNGKYVNMGDFKEIVYKHNRKNSIIISFQFDGKSELQVNTEWIEDKTNNLPKLFKLAANSYFFNLTAELSDTGYIVDYNYFPDRDPRFTDIDSQSTKKINDMIVGVFSETEPKKTRKKDSYVNIMTKYFAEIQSKQSIKNMIVEDIQKVDRISEKKGIAKLRQLLDLIAATFTTYDNNINFISSFRLHPERTYLEQSKSKLKVNNFGDGYLDQIIYWETKKRPEFKELIKNMKSLGLLNTIKSKRLEGGRYEITVKINLGGVDSSLSDVGFGISQFLPILVADLQLPNSSTLYIAQPEIHIHPSVQSAFGDYLNNQIKTKEKNYIIETHSEYLINKIRLLITKGELSEEDVKVYFIDNESSGNKIHDIKFTSKGQIVNAPKNFFKTYMIDVMDIAINSVD